MCVNALSGLFSFLHRQGIAHDERLSRCQCPKRAFLISTKDAICVEKDLAKKCQCPKRAFLISTWLKGNRCHSFQVSVNALSGLFSFLRFYVEKGKDITEVCQCPQRAFLISTVELDNYTSSMYMCVNALSGLFSFLLLFWPWR